MLFEWDAGKNRSNQKKHAGIDFETASRVFADPNLVLRKDRMGSALSGRRRRTQMAKKLSASSRRGKQIRVSAGSIWNKPLTERQKKALEGIRKKQKRADASEIDYSDIPALTDKQLAQFRRPPKKLVAVRLDADVFEWLQQYGAGYSTRINHVLRLVMSQGR